MADTRIVDDALVAFIGAEHEDDVYAAVVAAVHAQLPASCVVNTMLVAGTTTFRVTHSAGFDRYVGPIRTLAGFDPISITYDFTEMRSRDLAAYRSGRLEPVEGGLHALSLGRLPAPVSAVVERLLGIRSAHVIGYSWGDLHYGTLAIGLCRQDSLEHAGTIETLVHQATIAVRRLRAEDELRSKQAELDSFFHQSLDLLCIADVHGYFRRLNHEWQRTLGYPIRDLEGARFLDLVHPDDIDATRAAIERLAAGLTETRFVNRYRTSDGRYRWLEWRAFPRGELIYAAARDLTERIEAEQALRESESHYRLIADNTADVIWLMDPATGRFTYVSPSVQRLRGLTPEEVMTEPIEAALTPASFQKVMNELPPRITAAEEGDDAARIHVDEVDQPRRDGSIVATEVTTTFLTARDGRVQEILGVSRDISERRRAEAEIRALNASLESRVLERTAQLEDAVAELESFSYSVSHDLRAPLRAINGYATILLEDHGEEIGTEGGVLCRNIIGSTRRMGQLIDDLLAFARVGRVQLTREPVDMDALVASVLEELVLERQQSGVRLAVAPLGVVAGDAALLHQVWINLLDNALKFTAGADQPSVHVGRREEPDETVYFVADNGAGFDMRYSGQLFQVFQRLHAGEYEGSGIGLAIVRRAVEAHGGRVWAEGAPGAGATFFFALPATEATETPP